jgi:hypothetical protein
MVLTGRGNVSGRPYYSGNVRCQAQFLREWVKDPVTKKMVRDSPTKARRHLMRARAQAGFGWKRWSKKWLYEKLRLYHDYRLHRPWSTSESAASRHSLINLARKQTAKPIAGNRHDGFEAAGTGNRLPVRIMRHSQRKRGATARPNLRSAAPVLDPTRFPFSNYASAVCTARQTSIRERSTAPAVFEIDLFMQSTSPAFSENWSVLARRAASHPRLEKWAPRRCCSRSLWEAWASLAWLGLQAVVASVSTAAALAPEELKRVPAKSAVLGAESPLFGSGRQLALEEP